jgi:gluconokinase
MRYVVGVDIGTTSTKAVAFTAGGAVLGSSAASYPVFTDAGGRHELDPDQLFDAVLSVLRAVTGGSIEGEPEAVSLSCAMHSLILVDSEGKPLTKAMTWADLRSEAYAAALKGSESGRRIYRQTGTPIHAMSPLCKLLWLKDKQPALCRQAAHFIGIKEYIWWRLFGKYQVDLSIASATGLLDIRAFGWNAESLALVGVEAGQLSELVSCMHSESVLLPAWGSLGLPAGLRFVIGASDGCLANLGTGAVRSGETALTIGTSGAVRMAAARPEYDERERLFSYILDKELYICGGATNNGGNAVQWYSNLVQGQGSRDAAMLDKLVADAEGVPAGCEGLIFLPYLLGERAPIWDADAKGVFFGIRAIHGQAHFTRALLEGISYGLLQIGVSLEETIGPIGEIYASGGFTRNVLWLQLIADVFMRKVHVTAQADASAIGAAMLGWHALGIFDSLEAAASLAKIETTYEPDAARHGLYQRNFDVFVELYGRLHDLMRI